jgi:hypothetical protein
MASAGARGRLYRQRLGRCRPCAKFVLRGGRRLRRRRRAFAALRGGAAEMPLGLCLRRCNRFSKRSVDLFASSFILLGERTGYLRAVAPCHFEVRNSLAPPSPCGWRSRVGLHATPRGAGPWPILHQRKARRASGRVLVITARSRSCASSPVQGCGRRLASWELGHPIKRALRSRRLLARH